MMRKSNQSWFAQLRRDSGMFALLGTLVLLLNMFQPLSAANAGEGGHWVICTIYGAEEPVQADDLPSAMPENCPICVSGNPCSTSVPVYKAALAAEPAFNSPSSFVRPRLVFDAPPLPENGLSDPPFAIRAPPLSA